MDEDGTLIAAAPHIKFLGVGPRHIGPVAHRLNVSRNYVPEAILMGVADFLVEAQTLGPPATRQWVYEALREILEKNPEDFEFEMYDQMKGGVDQVSDEKKAKRRKIYAAQGTLILLAGRATERCTFRATLSHSQPLLARRRQKRRYVNITSRACN